MDATSLAERSNGSWSKLKKLLSSKEVADYVYMYPHRQAYSACDKDLSGLIKRSLMRSPDVNLYFHIPFCKQLCSFCNLYTTTRRDNYHAPYIEKLLDELAFYSEILSHLHVKTIYIGGGTPSLLEPVLVRKIVDAAFSSSGSVAADCEVAMEFAPEHASQPLFKEFVSAGINRINLGVQSTVNAEISSFGRRRSFKEDVNAVIQAMESGFSNVCVDLIYGLQHQTMETWQKSLISIIECRPNTICCYSLTARPHTGYGYKGVIKNDPESMRERYDIACKLISAAGYTQETHVRWARDGGGYKQKENHWAMENLIGIGAGARSYLWDVDFRNGYSIVNRKSILEEYLNHDFSSGLFARDHFLMDDDERKRKFIILGLCNLEISKYYEMFGSYPEDDFPDEFDALKKEGLIEKEGAFIRLNTLGMRHRDNAVCIFVSSKILQKLEYFDYSE